VLGIEDNPNPAATWLYVCVPEMEERQPAHAHFPLPTGPDPNAGFVPLRTPGFGGGGPGPVPADGRHVRARPQDSPRPVRQYGGSPGYFVRLVGRAVRFAYEIPRPVCPPIAGVQPFDANDPRLGHVLAVGPGRVDDAPDLRGPVEPPLLRPAGRRCRRRRSPVMPNPFQQSPAPVR
jgi:hypothetical protein